MEFQNKLADLNTSHLSQKSILTKYLSQLIQATESKKHFLLELNSLYANISEAEEDLHLLDNSIKQVSQNILSKVTEMKNSLTKTYVTI